ncbi:hypothetical protein [Micromonospora sp. NPDC005173]|uniref:hypothetical protein n=1 Tax=Micromonospora sp. NPDC005173 TaxID=3157165 RepID=UPI0033A4264D
MNIDYNLAFAGLSAVATIAGAGAGYLAWRAARSASEAAHTSARVASDSDRDRRWSALLPQFTFTCVAGQNNARADLRIRLDGPYTLERIDRVTVSIRDDRPDRGRHLLAGGPTAEQVANQVWGPYRFNTNVENVDKPHGRRVAFPDGVTVGEDLVCSLEETLIPAWSESRSPNWWRDEYSGKPVRLMIECERDGLPPWRIPADVEVLLPPSARSALV